MRNVNRALTALLGALVLVLAGLVPSASAATAGPTAGTQLMCNYQLHHHKLSGHCHGNSHLGALSGPFSGKVKLHGNGKGTMKLKLKGLDRSAEGTSGTTLTGTFSGSSFISGNAHGQFHVSFGTIHISGTFVAVLG
ncbi:hypothetical protein [Haloechinothrix halophila]|uniref:hypothetical protein n=1 Tax=Haloechinothrix halophila TaxID=1069073 RepID=UPI00042A15B1|nr:hypothetical protein [Haloechinothrix halophila]